MLHLGTNHPDFVYPNDQLQAKVALVTAFFAALLCSIMIVVTVLH